ncbi:transposable element Tcb2 transposase [Trichonephila clavipes]|nr:transposable element Tcb2 transposase [Trichonephila clavipes]
MRIFIWRDRGSRNNPAFVHESVRFGGGGALVDEILRPIAVPYAAAIGDDFILMDDNCGPHRANLGKNSLFEEGIVRMEWPACSPDMNPIEHVWDALERRVAGRQPPAQTLQKLERALLEEWDKIPQLVINSLIDSMPQRFNILKDNEGRRKQHSRSFMARREPRVLPPIVKNRGEIPLQPKKCLLACILKVSKSPKA